jgi:hypothetical protein
MAKGRKTGGRQRGTLNTVTVEARAFCAGIVDDPLYQARLRKRALSGQLAPALEAMLWHYAKGKPTEHVEVPPQQTQSLIEFTLTIDRAHAPELAPEPAERVIDVEPKFD